MHCHDDHTSYAPQKALDVYQTINAFPPFGGGVWGRDYFGSRMHKQCNNNIILLLVVMKIICAGRAFAKVTRFLTGTHAHIGLVKALRNYHDSGSITDC